MRVKTYTDRRTVSRAAALPNLATAGEVLESGSA
jgi:hypothetical protein